MINPCEATMIPVDILENNSTTWLNIKMEYWAVPGDIHFYSGTWKKGIKLNLMSTGINLTFMTLYFSACGDSRYCVESSYVLCVSFLPTSFDSFNVTSKLFYLLSSLYIYMQWALLLNMLVCCFSEIFMTHISRMTNSLLSNLANLEDGPIQVRVFFVLRICWILGRTSIRSLYIFFCFPTFYFWKMKTLYCFTMLQKMQSYI